MLTASFLFFTCRNNQAVYKCLHFQQSQMCGVSPSYDQIIPKLILRCQVEYACMHLAGEWFVTVNAVSTATCMHTNTYTHTHTHAILADKLSGDQQL